MLKKILLIAIIIVLLVGTNLVQFMYWRNELQVQTTILQQKIDAYKATIEAMGTMVPVYALREDKTAGTPITSEDLEEITIPNSMFKDFYINSPEAAIGKIIKCDLTAGTGLTTDLLLEEDIGDTVRYYDVYVQTLPVGLKKGDYVDYRIIMPYGEDFIILPKKRVIGINGKTLKFHLSQEEIHTYQAALLDYYLNSRAGAMIYVTVYPEPSLQPTAEAFYSIPSNIIAIINSDPNILAKVDAAVMKESRALIEAALSKVDREESGLISSGRNEVQSSINQGAHEWTQKDKKEQEAEEKEKELIIQEGVVQ